MFFVLLALWIIFNARLTLDVLLVGIVLSAILTWFGRKYCRWSTTADRNALKLLLKSVRYSAGLFIEIIKSNLSVLKIIASPHAKMPTPVLFFFDTKLKSNTAKMALANSITLTPGTYTVGIYDSTFAVHALNAEFADGTIDSSFNQQLITMETQIKEEASK